MSTPPISFADLAAARRFNLGSAQGPDYDLVRKILERRPDLLEALIQNTQPRPDIQRGLPQLPQQSQQQQLLEFLGFLGRFMKSFATSGPGTPLEKTIDYGVGPKPDPLLPQVPQAWWQQNPGARKLP